MLPAEKRRPLIRAFREDDFLSQKMRLTIVEQEDDVFWPTFRRHKPPANAQQSQAYRLKRKKKHTVENANRTDRPAT